MVTQLGGEGGFETLPHRKSFCPKRAASAGRGKWFLNSFNLANLGPLRQREEKPMLDKVTEDIKNAMKAKDKIRLDALRMLKSAFIENNTSPKPKADIDVAIAHVKKLRDSMESYPAGSAELDKIRTEIDCLAEYLPKPMGRDEFEALVRNFLAQNPGSDFGKVMKGVSAEIKGRFDGREASELIKSILGA